MPSVIRDRRERVSSHEHLQQAAACLECRKRKLICDGSKPSCGPCIKSFRSDLCKFDDTSRWSKERRLRLEISNLIQQPKEAHEHIFALEQARRFAEQVQYLTKGELAASPSTSTLIGGDLHAQHSVPEERAFTEYDSAPSTVAVTTLPTRVYNFL